MSNLTNHAENALVDQLRGEDMTLPTDWHVALGSAGSETGITEITGTGYARQAVARSLTAWSGTQGDGTTLPSTGTSHTTSNNAAVDYGTAGSAWGSATHIGLFDASTAGNCWVWYELPDPMTIGNGDPVSIDASTIRLRFGLAGGMSDYLANKLIDLMFRDEAYTWPASLSAAYCTTSPSNSARGTEPGVGGYARVAIASSLAAWSGTQAAGSTVASTGTGGRTSNNAAITFPLPTADQGAIGWVMLLDGSNNMLFWHALASIRSIRRTPVGGDPPEFAANTLGITFA